MLGARAMIVQNQSECLTYLSGPVVATILAHEFPSVVGNPHQSILDVFDFINRQSLEWQTEPRITRSQELGTFFEFHQGAFNVTVVLIRPFASIFSSCGQTEQVLRIRSGALTSSSTLNPKYIVQNRTNVVVMQESFPPLYQKRKYW